MDAEIDTENCDMEVVEVDLVFRKPPEITDFELVKTFWIDPREETNFNNDQSVEHEEFVSKSEPDQESKQLQPLALKTIETTEDDGSSCSNSEDDRLPEEILNEPLDDEVFEEEEMEIENVTADLIFRQPKDKQMELVYTISKGATINLDELEEEDEDVDVDLWFREPTDTRFELVYTIPLMEDVSVDSLGGTQLEDVPPSEELDNVVEEATEFTFKPIETDEDKTETETLTTEVVTVLEKAQNENVGEGSRDFIEKVKLTSNDTFDDFDGEEEAFQNAFVKSVETPETPTPKGDFDDEPRDDSVSDVLKDAAEKLLFIQDSENLEFSKEDRDTMESDDVANGTASAPDILEVESPEEQLPVSISMTSDDVENQSVETGENNTEVKNFSEEEKPSEESLPISNDDNSNSPEAVDRFDVTSVEESEIVDSTLNVNHDNVTTLPTETESPPSDFAQLESISATDDVPDVYKTLDSLRNEDVFPKEKTPSPPENSAIEVTPEAEKKESHEIQSELKLEDSGIVATSDILDLETEVITDALNSEDVVQTSEDVKGNQTFESESNDRLSATVDDQSNTVEMVKLEDSGEVETPEKVVLDNDIIDEALNSEDAVATEDLAVPVTYNEELEKVEEPEPMVKLEDSGLCPVSDAASVNGEVIRDALNCQDVVKTHDSSKDTGAPESDENCLNVTAAPVENDQLVDSTVDLKLEDSGIIDTPEIVDLETKEITEALNSEDVEQTSEVMALQNVSTDYEEKPSQLDAAINDSGLEMNVSESNQEVLGLEESGIDEVTDIVDLESKEMTDALNGEDVVDTSEQAVEITDPPVVPGSGTDLNSSENVTADSNANADSDVESEQIQSVIGLEESGMGQVAETVDLEMKEITDAMNSEDVLRTSADVVETMDLNDVSTLDDASADEPETDVTNYHVEAETEEAVAEPEQVQGVIGLEESGVTATPDIVALEERTIPDALNSEDVVKASDENPIHETKETKTEGVSETEKVESDVSELEDNTVESKEPEKIASEVKLEDCGAVESSDIVEINENVNEDALNCEDVIKRSDEVPNLLEAIANEEHSSNNVSHPETESDIHDPESSHETADIQDELKLEESGSVATPEVVKLNQEIIANALNSEDVVTENMAESPSKLIFPDNFLDEDELLSSEVEESVADSEIEGSLTEDKESTPLQDPTAEEGSEAEKFDAMTEDSLPVDCSSVPEQFEEANVEPQHQKDEELPQETEVPEDNHGSTSAENSIMEKLISMVEEVLPADAVIPSEHVLNEAHINEAVTNLEIETDEPLPDDTKSESMVQTLVSMVQTSIPHSSEKTSDKQMTEEVSESVVPVESYSVLESEIPSLPAEKPVDEEESLVQKLVSMVENVLPLSSEEKPAEQITEDVTTESQLVQSEESDIPQEETTSIGESIMGTLVSMVENVLPVDAIILSDYVDQVEKHFDENRVSPPLLFEEVEKEVTDVTEKEEPESLNDEGTAENSRPGEKSVDTISDRKLEETIDERAVVPDVETEVIRENPITANDEDTKIKEHVKEDDAFVDKLVSVVENAFPTEDVVPSEDVINEDHIERAEDVSENQASELISEPEPEKQVVLQDETKNEDSEEMTSIQQDTDGKSVFETIDSVVEEASLVTALPSDVQETPTSNATKVSREEEPQQETMLNKLVSTLEGVLPTGIMASETVDVSSNDFDNQPKKLQRPLETENKDGVTVAEIVATADIILPVGEQNVEVIETPFDAEAFVHESETAPVDRTESCSKEATEEKVIETADIIMPVETEGKHDSSLLETPFEAEVFPSEARIGNSESVPEEKEEILDTQNEKSTTVEELVAMAVDILPIDGAVSENIDVTVEEKPSQNMEASSATLEQPEEHPVESSTMSSNGVPLTQSFSGSESFKRVKRGGSYEEAVHQDNSVSADDFFDSEVTDTLIPVPIIRRYEGSDANKATPASNENEIQVATVEVVVEQDTPGTNPEEVASRASELKNDVEKPIPVTNVTSQETSSPHKITDLHFTIPKNHEDYGNDYLPFGTEPSKVEFNNPDEVKEEEDDVVAELNFHPVRQWKDEDVISLQSLKSLVAEVGCTTDVEEVPKLSKSQQEESESTLKILKVVPSEPSLMELDISNDPSVIHVPIPLMEPATKYLEDMVEWIIAEAVKEVSEMEVVTESELSEMVPQVSETECSIPEPLSELKLPFEDDEKTPEPEQAPGETPIEVTSVVDTETVPTLPQRPPRAPKTESSKSVDPPKSRVRFGPLNIKLGRSYSEEQQKELVEMLERPLTVITATEPKSLNTKETVEALSPLSPDTLAEYEEVPMMDMQSVPHSPQEKQEEPELVKEDEKPVESVEALKKTEVVEEESSLEKAEVPETRILGPGKSMEYVGNDEEDGSECLDSIGDLSERTIQRFNTSIDDPAIRRDSFSSISSFGDRQKFRTAIENIRQDLLPFQSSVSQYLDPSVTPSQQLLVTNLSMDSPSDLSPNAPPVGFENTAQYLEKMQQQEDRPSAEGSIDSSGFEKVDHESLEDYSAPVQDPMQKSVFGSLGADAEDMKPGSQDDGFVFIERNEANEGAKQKMSSHHDDVIEKNYFGDDAATAKLLESPIAEEARKLVQDAVESASEYSKHAVDDSDEIGRELLDNVENKVDQAKEPIADTLHKAYDGLGDFVHETVPQAVHDFVEDVKQKLPESPVPERAETPEKVETPEPLDDIHDSVDKVHDEINNFLRSGRDPTPPLVEADEDAPVEDKPQFGNQTPEEDETTFDRKGPLTIPEEVEKAAAAQKYDEGLDEFDPLVSSNTGAAFGAAVGAAASEALTEEEMFGHQKFETVPRPPTPPKDISDEDVKPSTVNLGPAHHHSHPSSPHHSILKHHGEAWIDFKTVPPCVLDVIYWRDPKKSGIVFVLAVLALYILAKYPILTVITYSLLLALGAAAGFRVFKKVESQIKKTNTENPFSEILAQDLSLPQEKVHAQADVFVEHATCIANTLKKLVFVESPLESIKFGLVLWSLTYVASWFSGFTMALIAILGAFSIPKIYEANQDAIDPHLATISGHLKNVQNLIDEKLPFLRSAPVAAEEKKDQ